MSRPATPLDPRLGPSSRPHSRPGTPHRAHTPSRLQRDYNETTSSWIKDPPNNLGLEDPSQQSRTNDLIGSQNTEPTKWGDPMSEEETKRIQDLANKLGGGAAK
ncbi:hypothetical protein JCM10212_005641 [Sporobolomyces blumeae]